MKVWYRSPSLVPTLLLVSWLAAAPSQGDTPNPKNEIHRANTILASEPRIEVTPEGIVHVNVKTLRPCSGYKAFLGLLPRVAELEYPVYRTGGKAIQHDAQTFSFKFSIKELERDNLDIDSLKEHRGGHLALRISIFGDNFQTFDRTFAYRRSSDGRYFRAPALVEGPFVDCVSDTGAVISWEFDQATACRLEVEPDGDVIEFSEARIRREVALSNLSPETSYSYVITWTPGDVSLSSPSLEFRTAPPRSSDQPFCFAVLSDSRLTYGQGDRAVEGHNQRVLQALMNQAYGQGVSLILFPGDLVSGHLSDPEELESQFRAWKRSVTPVGGRIPIFEGIGNHDVTARFFEISGNRDYAPRSGQEASEVLFARHFVNPTNGPAPVNPDYPPYQENVYSFDWGNTHFTILNSNYMQKGPGDMVADMAGELEGTLRGEQLDWLDEDLRAARQSGQSHLFVFVHEPAFPNGGHVADAMWWDGKIPEMVQMRNRFWRILCRHRVLAVFSGDEHNYSRALIDKSVDPSFDIPIWQIITGGAGAPFYARDENVPWAESVQAFYPLPHLCIVNVDGGEVNLTVLSSEGFLVEQVELKRE